MMMRRGGLLMAAAAAGLCLAASTPLLAKPGVVRTKEGQVYAGDVVDKPKDDFLTVTVHGITTRIDRADVSEITQASGVDAEYKRRLAGLDPKDAKGRMDLARWAFDQKRYDLARDAAYKALEADPNSAEATEFLTLVQSQQRMERARAEQPDDARDATTGPDAAAPTTTHVRWTLLSSEDVNRIRQEELRRTDTRARFLFRNDVEKRFLASHREYTLSGWRSMTPVQRAIQILDQGDPELRDDVYMTTDPGSILEFRRLVQPVVLSTCATAACHGGSLGGPLVLNTTATTNEAATYTNFYILQRYRQNIETPGQPRSVFGSGATQEMIDRAHPEDSLLLQYGLPRDEAKFPHPAVQGFRPAFHRGRDDTKYQAIARWIGTSLLIDAPQTPNYGIDYDPPTGSASTAQPATTTATPGGSDRHAHGRPAAATRPTRRR